MFDKFTDRARKIIALAQKEAERWVSRTEERERLIQRLASRSGGVNPVWLSTVG